MTPACEGLTLWGEKAELDLAVGAVVFLRSVKVSDFNGRSLDLNEADSIEDHLKTGQKWVLMFYIVNYYNYCNMHCSV